MESQNKKSEFRIKCEAEGINFMPTHASIDHILSMDICDVENLVNVQYKMHSSDKEIFFIMKCRVMLWIIDSLDPNYQMAMSKIIHEASSATANEKQAQTIYKTFANAILYENASYSNSNLKKSA